MNRKAGLDFRIFLMGLLLTLNQDLSFASDQLSSESRVDMFFDTINNFWAGILFWDNHPLKLPIILIVMVGGGIFFTLRYGFVNLRLFRHAIDVTLGKYDKQDSAGEISHFQALTSALSATVGLGNIAGVAVAISLGGPGAVLWLWLVAFFGMSMKFSSCAFAQMYRIVHKDGTILGGPMVYLESAFREQLPKIAWLGKGFAVIFAIFTIGASIGAGNIFQVNQTYELLSTEFPVLKDHNWLIGILLAFGIGIVIIGGIRRIGIVTSRMIPFMCIFYCVSCLFIIFSNLSEIPGIFRSIFIQAFNPDAIWAGGFIGVLTQGVRRASFSNEAGMGSASIAHAAAKTDKPVREGIVAMLGPFIDTHLVCSMTALAILSTGVHLDPSLAGKGAAITAAAFASLGKWMPLLLTFAATIFAYSTAISWSYYGEKGTEYLFGKKAIFWYRIFYVCAAAIGPVVSLSKVIEFSDLMLLTMAFPNIIGMMILSGSVKIQLSEYIQQFRSGAFQMNSGMEAKKGKAEH